MRIFTKPLVLAVSMAALTACVDTRLPDSAAHLPDKPVNPNAPLSAMVEGSTVSTQPLQGTSGAAPVAPVQAAAGTAGISDEQDFQAVSSRETIESDAARRAANQAQYQQIEPTALPERPKGQGVSIVEYALSTTNSVGDQLYKRFSLGGQKRFQRNCASYGSTDVAQQAFLNSGGPKRDRYGIDPDGDGFACSWDPAPFRKVRNTPAPAPALEGQPPEGVSASDLAAVGITGSAPATSAAPLPGDTLNISTE